MSDYEHDIDGVKVPSDMCAAFAYAYQERFGGVPGGIAVGLAGVLRWQAGIKEGGIMFDPEKVSDVPPYVFNEYNQSYRAVARVDYDALLALYREVRHQLNQGMNDSASVTRIK